jgi:hypothetical protein
MRAVLALQQLLDRGRCVGAEVERAYPLDAGTGATTHSPGKRGAPMIDVADGFMMMADRAFKQRDTLVKALEKVRSYNVDIAAGRINYRPHDHIQVIDEALAAVSSPPNPGAKHD